MVFVNGSIFGGSKDLWPLPEVFGILCSAACGNILRLRSADFFLSCKIAYYFICFG